MKKTILLSALFLWASVLSTSFSKAYGSGFAIYTQGASALGQADAVAAHTDSPSAIFFNPALITRLEGTQIEAGTTVIFPSEKFTSALTGKTFKTEHEVFHPSAFFVTHKFNESFSMGIAIFSPFGLSTKWGNTWEGRYITTNSDLKTFDINPVLSFRLTPHISVSAGFDYLTLDSTLEKMINLSPFGLPDVSQKFKGDGNGIGYTLGGLFDIGKDVSLGISYRSRIDVDITGDASHGFPPGMPPQITSLFPNTTGKTTITLPSRVQAGIAYKGIDRLTVEAGVRWEGWSSFKQLKIDLSTPIAGNSSSLSDREWKDAYSMLIGAKYKLSDPVTLLAGYLYSGNPVPDQTFEPAIPDASSHLLAVGTEIRYKRLTFAFSYAYQMLQGRDKNNSIDDNPFDGATNPAASANGRYKSDIHMLGFSLAYRF